MDRPKDILMASKNRALGLMLGVVVVDNDNNKDEDEVKENEYHSNSAILQYGRQPIL
jgi:hypothetical protein